MSVVVSFCVRVFLPKIGQNKLPGKWFALLCAFQPDKFNDTYEIIAIAASIVGHNSNKKNESDEEIICCREKREKARKIVSIPSSFVAI